MQVSVICQIVANIPGKGHGVFKFMGKVSYCSLKGFEGMNIV